MIDLLVSTQNKAIISTFSLTLNTPVTNSAKLNQSENTNVLMLLDREFPPDVRVENEIEILRGDGIGVTVLAFTRTDRPLRETLANGAVVHRAPINSLVYKSSVACLKHPMYFNFWRSAVRRILSSIRVDAIHVHDLPLARVGREYADEIGVPMILDLHENWPFMLDVAEHTRSWLGRLLSNPEQWRDYEREMAAAADAIVTVVDEMRSRIIALDADPNRVFVYQNVPDQLMLEQALPKTSSDEFRLFYAGGINIHRGLQVVLDAIALSKDRLGPFKFRVLGNGRYLKELREQAARLGIETLVEFAGWVDQHNVIRALAEADLAIVPHLRSIQNDNSSPNKIFQYMLSETAVITSDCLSLQRVVTETRSGLVYPNTSPEALSEKLIWAFGHKDELREMGVRGKAAVMTEYNTEVQREGIVRAYRKIGVL